MMENPLFIQSTQQALYRLAGQINKMPYSERMLSGSKGHDTMGTCWKDS